METRVSPGLLLSTCTRPPVFRSLAVCLSVCLRACVRPCAWCMRRTIEYATTHLAFGTNLARRAKSDLAAIRDVQTRLRERDT